LALLAHHAKGIQIPVCPNKFLPKTYLDLVDTPFILFL